LTVIQALGDWCEYAKLRRKKRDLRALGKRCEANPNA
jgi:hypothetical protein